MPIFFTDNKNAIDKEKRSQYRGFVEQHDLPLFFQPWYLDAVSDPMQWDAVLYKENNSILGVWPILKKKKWGVRVLTQPVLTPYLGPWVVTPKNVTKKTSRRKLRKKVLNGLAHKLPKATWTLCHTHYKFGSWQPLSWMGFYQTTRYTFTIDLKQPKEALLAAMSDKTRNKIVCAQNNVAVRPSEDSELIYSLIKKSFERQKAPVPFSSRYLSNLDSELKQRNARKIWIAYRDQIPVAGVYITYDRHSAYLLLTGRTNQDPGGSVGLLIWQAIQESHELGKETFDFEGSMIESIAFFFDSFGGQQRPYHRLYKTANKSVLLMLKALNRL